MKQKLSPLIVAGMHRSGTSLTASLLSAMALDFGQNFVPQDSNNPHGYFEDVDFVELQRKILRYCCAAGSNGHHDWGWTENEKLDRDCLEKFRHEAQALLNVRINRSSQWGWKDPRTTLLLDFWDELLEGNARYVLVYRYPWDVADSMQRLGAEIFLRNPEYAYRIWIYYNRHLCDFYSRHTDRCLLVSINALRGRLQLFTSLLLDKLGLPDSGVNLEELFDSDLFPTVQGEDPLISHVAQIWPDCVHLLREMDQMADISSAGLWQVGRVRSSVARFEVREETQPINVSVVIPCYNQGTLLIEAISSVERFAPADSELIIINDASRDARTLEILGILRLSGYRIIDHRQNMGLSAARNTGIAQARGAYILPLDDDNRLRSGFVQQAIQVLESRSEIGVVYGDRYDFGLRNGLQRVQEFDLDKMLNGNYIDACAIFRKQVWEDCNGYDVGMPVLEDWEFWIHAAELGWGFHHLDVVALDYRVRPGSLVSKIAHTETMEVALKRIWNKHPSVCISYAENLKRKMDLQTANLSQTIESLIIDRDAQKSGFEQLQDSIVVLTRERDEQAWHLNQSLIERNIQIADLNRNIAKRDEVIANLSHTIKSLIIDRDDQKSKLDQMQSSVAALTRERDGQVLRLNEALAERDRKLASLQMELSAVYSSKSWRITSPLRGLVRGMHKFTGHALRGKLRHAPPANPYSNRKNGAVVNAPEVATSEGGNRRHRILLVSYYCPARAHAGGLRILDIYALIRQRCPDVQLDLFTHHRPDIDWSLDDAYRIFHNVYLAPTEDLTPHGLNMMRGSPLSYDVIDLQFHQTGFQMDAFRRIGGKIIFTPMESVAKVLFIDMRTGSLMKNGLRLFKTATSLRLAAEEIDFVSKADEVVCVSRADAAFLRAVTSSRHIRGVDTGVSHFEFAEALAPGFAVTGAADRPCRVLYVAYFGSETNVGALLWYLEHVHPLIKASVPGYTLTVVGRGDMSPFTKYRDGSTEFVGEVPALAPHIQQARVGIAPALGGSGFRGKVNQYAVLGVPCVVSPIAFKGLAYQDAISIFIAETPEIFADRCIRLLTDPGLNDRMGLAARKQCLERYSWQSKWGVIRKIYRLEEFA